MAAEQLATNVTPIVITSDRRDANFKRLFNDLVSDLQYYDPASVAEAAGISQQTIYNWVNRNVKFPSTKTFFRVAQAMGWELTWKKK